MHRQSFFSEARGSDPREELSCPAERVVHADAELVVPPLDTEPTAALEGRAERLVGAWVSVPILVVTVSERGPERARAHVSPQARARTCRVPGQRTREGRGHRDPERTLHELGDALVHIERRCGRGVGEQEPRRLRRVVEPAQERADRRDARHQQPHERDLTRHALGVGLLEALPSPRGALGELLNEERAVGPRHRRHRGARERRREARRDERERHATPDHLGREDLAEDPVVEARRQQEELAARATCREARRGPRRSVRGGDPQDAVERAVVAQWLEPRAEATPPRPRVDPGVELGRAKSLRKHRELVDTALLECASQGVVGRIEPTLGERVARGGVWSSVGMHADPELSEETPSGAVALPTRGPPRAIGGLGGARGYLDQRAPLRARRSLPHAREERAPRPLLPTKEVTRTQGLFQLRARASERPLRDRTREVRRARLELERLEVVAGLVQKLDHVAAWKEDRVRLAARMREYLLRFAASPALDLRSELVSGFHEDRL